MVALADGTAQNRTAPFTVGLLLAPRCSMTAFVSVVEPLRAANYLHNRDFYSWKILTSHGQPIATSNGLQVMADCSIKESGFLDLVVLLTDELHTGCFDPSVLRWLRALGRSGAMLAAVDTATFVLAEAGLLDGYRATVHWSSIDALSEKYPKIMVRESLYVIDSGRLTCAGATAALDMMFHLISEQHGESFASALTDWFVHGRRRHPGEPQRNLQQDTNGRRDEVSRALSLMNSNVEQPLSLGRLASEVGISLRRLERAFQRRLGASPKRRYLDIRLQRARSMLEYTDMRVLEVAIATGFVSSRHFSSAYRAWSGFAPLASRHYLRKARAG